MSDGSLLKGNCRTAANSNVESACAAFLSLGCVHAQEFNQWFALYRDSATTEHLKTAASRQQKQDILEKVHLATFHPNSKVCSDAFLASSQQQLEARDI